MQDKMGIAISAADYITSLLYRLDVDDPQEIVAGLRTEFGRSSLVGAILACLDVAEREHDRLSGDPAP